MEYCKKYCNTDLKKTIAISIAIVFPPSIAIAIAILFASIANNPAVGLQTIKYTVYPVAYLEI